GGSLTTTAQVRKRTVPIISHYNVERDPGEPEDRAKQIGDLYRIGVKSWLTAGKMLKEERDERPRGQWLAWLKENAAKLGFNSTRTAQRLIALAASNATSDVASFDLWGNARRKERAALPKLEASSSRQGLARQAPAMDGEPEQHVDLLMQAHAA